jgi:hypothetical protein
MPITQILLTAASAPATPTPTYTLLRSSDNVDEGSSVTLTIGGTNIVDGTYYWTIETNAGDFAETDGTVTITSNSGSIVLTPTEDATTESEVTETFTVALRSGSINGEVLVTSAAITINDTSQTPETTYTITPAADNVDEGSSLEFTVGGTNITNGTYYWTIETDSDDFATISGTVSVTDNSGTFSVTPYEDSTTEGVETFIVYLRSGSITGTILQTSSSVTINDTSLAPPFSLEFNQPQQDFLRVDASSSFNLGNNWTIEFWISANNGSLSSPRIPGGQWGLINQGGWYYGMANDNSILVGLAGGNLTINQSSTGAIEFAEPTPNGVPSGAVTKISDNQGWDENNVGTNLPTTGGTGTGLTVNVSDSGSNYAAISINTPGSGYTNGDVITVTRPDVSDTFSISVPNPVVWTHAAIVNNGGGSAQKVYYNGVEQAKVTGSYTSNGKTNTSDDIYIGRLAPNYSSHFDGKMAMVRISNTAKYLTAFTPSTTYDVETDTVLFLDSDTPLIGQSYFELNGVTLSVNGGNNIYFNKEAYPNLDTQIQIGDTVVNVSNPSPVDSVVAGAVYSADPANWGVPITPGWGDAGTVNFSGTRSASVTNNGVTISTDFPPASITITNVSVDFNSKAATVDFTANITQSETASIFFEWSGGGSYSGPYTLQVNPGVNTYTSPTLSSLSGSGSDLTTEITIALGVNACTSNIYTGAWSVICLVEGTMVTMADGSYKAIEDIGYNDLIRVWNFDLGEFSEALPVFVKQEETHAEHYQFTFSDGTVLRTVGHHVFNKQAGAFTMLVRDTTPVGTITFNELGEEVTLISKETIQEPVKFYNVWTQYHLNLFAQGILTSNRFNNIYPIQDMKFVKDNRALRPLEEFANIDPKYISGLRLQEQPAHYSAEYIRDYVENKLERLDIANTVNYVYTE